MADSNIYLATTNNEHYLINPIDWTNKTGNGVEDNSIPGSKIKDASIPSSKIIGEVASEDTYAREQLLLKQNINDESLKTTNKTIVGAINEIYDNGGGGGSGEVVDTVARNRTQNIDSVRESYTHFSGTLSSNVLEATDLNNVTSILSDGLVINNNLSISSNLLKFKSDISGIDNPIHIDINENNQNQPNILQAKGWFIQGWSLLESTTRKYKLWLGKEQKQFADITKGEPTSWIKPELGTLAKDDVLTIYNDRHWLNKLIVEAVNPDGTIQVKDISTPYDGSTALPPSGNTNFLNFRYGLFVSGKYINKLVSVDTSKLNIGEAELTFNSFSL